MGDELRATGFAVGSGHTDHGHRGTGLTVKAAGNVACLCCQIGNGQHDHALTHLHALPLSPSVRQHRRRAAGNGLIDVIAGIMIFAEAGKKQISGRHLARIKRDAAHTDVVFGRQRIWQRHESRQQLYQ